MSSVSTQNTHPLKAVVLAADTRDPIGHLVADPNGDREFRFVKMRGGITASQGVALIGYRLSGVDNDYFQVCTSAAGTSCNLKRDFIGIAVCQSTATSGMAIYAMTKGTLGKKTESLYPDTVWAFVSGNAAITAGMALTISSRAAGSAAILFRARSAWDVDKGGSQLSKIIGQTLSTDTAAGKLTRGVIRSNVLYGGVLGVGVI